MTVCLLQFWQSHLSNPLSVIPQAEKDICRGMSSLSLDGVLVNVVAKMDLPNIIRQILVMVDNREMGSRLTT